MQYATFEKKPETDINTLISAFEETISNYGANYIYQTQTLTKIEKTYEAIAKGAIVARFVHNNGPRFTVSLPNQKPFQTDILILYLGFDESSIDYNSMVSNVQNTLRMK